MEAHVDKLIKAKPTFSTKFLEGYIERPDLDNKILRIYNTLQSPVKKDRYYVVYGVKGVGKSFAIANALHGKDGVVAVVIHQGFTIERIFQRIFEAFGISAGENVAINDFLRAISEVPRQLNYRRLTIVLEIESLDEGVLAASRLVAKWCSESANVIAVLSEATAVLAFSDDCRARFIRVDGMQRAEAHQYFNHLKDIAGIQQIENDKIEAFFDTVGTSPFIIKSCILAISEGECTMEKYIRETVERACCDLVAFPPTQILRALKANPSGISTSSFMGQNHGDVNLAQPKDVARFMVRNRAILYDVDSRQYKLYSKTHESVLVQFPYIR